MPIRGKILNCLKADYARICKSDVIVDLIKVMGCGVELSGKHNKELATFNLENLRIIRLSSVPTRTWTATRSAPWC